MKRAGNIFFLVCAFVLTAWGQTYTIETVPNPQTNDRYNFVSNPDGILQSATVSAINIAIDSLRQVSGTEIAVVALNSVGYDDIDDFANRLYNHWKIGQEQQSNGVLVLLVMDARGVVIRTGYGAEGILPDAISKRIISQTIIPEFQKGNFDAGMLSGVNQIIDVLKGEPFVIEKEEPVNWNVTLPYAAAVYLLLMLLTLLWIRSSVKKVYQNKALSTNLMRYLAIKDQNKATYTIAAFVLPIVALFLIIFFAKAAYILLLLPVPVVTLPAYLYGKRAMNKARRAPIPCNECGNQMHFVSESKEDTYLKLSQQFEEKLNSVDYDVFLCDTCKNEAVFSLDKLSSYSQCPRCNTKAYALVSTKTVVMPTYINSGTQRSVYKCKFCGFEDHKDTKLPRLRRSSAVAGGAVGGSVFSGRGGFGGGGGGSFGGGMTGGGGASGRW